MHLEDLLEAYGEAPALAIAYLEAGGNPPRSVHSFEMANVLRSAGVEEPASLAALAERIAGLARRLPGFEVDGPYVRALSHPVLLAHLSKLAGSGAGGPSGRRKRPRADRASARETRARARDERQGPRPSGRRAAERPRAPHTPIEPSRARAARPPSPAAPEALLPDAPLPTPVEVLPVAVSLGDWAERASAMQGSVAAVSLALRGRLIAHASAFQELLGIASLRGVESLPHQLETVRRVLRVLRGRALLADEVGLGKTIEALMVLREYQLRGMVRRALVLAPPSLTRQWRGELEAKGGIEVWSTDDPGFRADPAGFWRGEGVRLASLSLARSTRHAPLVQAEPWDLVIVDEAHHLKNRTTLAYRLVNGLKSRFLLLLTATPVETDLEEVFNLVTLLAPGQLTTPAAFRRQFVDPRDPTRPKDAERLRRLLGEVMVRNTRAQSGLALPPRYVETIAVEPLPDERAAYQSVVALLRDHARDGRARLAATTLLLEAGSSPAACLATLAKLAEKEGQGEALRASASRIATQLRGVARCRKLEALLEIVRAAPEQVLVFTRYRQTADYVATAVRELGVKVESFHGGVPSAERCAAVERFRAGARCLIATDIGAEGQNLQFCQLLVNFDLPWNPAQIEQRIGRLHRMGQTGEVRVFNLCAKGTVEDRVLDVLDRRLHLFELVVGEMDMVLGNLVDERDLEERILQLYAESSSESEVVAGFDRIAEELARARGLYERSRELDQALFRRDFET
jgi:superfamily II DNA or RNA helicase